MKDVLYIILLLLSYVFPNSVLYSHFCFLVVHAPFLYIHPVNFSLVPNSIQKKPFFPAFDTTLKSRVLRPLSVYRTSYRPFTLKFSGYYPSFNTYPPHFPKLLSFYKEIFMFFLATLLSLSVNFSFAFFQCENILNYCLFPQLTIFLFF